MALMLWSTVHGISSLAVANPALPRGRLPAHAVVELTGHSVIGGFATGLAPQHGEPR